MLTLEDIIDSKDNLEMKRALAVKMVLLGFKTKDICRLLGVSDSFVSKWKIVYEKEGPAALRLQYKGGKGFLTEDERYEIIYHLRNLPHCTVEELKDYIERHYGVVYQSRQSYYDLLKLAELSWHRTQAVNPKYNEAQVLSKREEIRTELAAHQAEIVSGELIVFLEDECHLVWGDAQGYVWGRRNERTVVPIQNTRQRQTYYGVLNLYDHTFILNPYASANGKHTIEFIEYLRNRYPGKKLMIIWDGASYHHSKEIQAYLGKVNEGLEKKDWKVTCIILAPYAPQQNPVEDVWLRGKNFVRRHFYENNTFYRVKMCFLNFLNNRVFNFSKLNWYINIPQPA
jgi:putative transposase